MEEDDREAPPPANVDDDMNEDADAPPAAEAEATDKKESKSQRALDLLYNPMKSDHDKSLWQFFTNQVAKLPTVDDLAKERELAGREVVMEEVQLEWYDRVLQMYRNFLQMVFEEPVELAALGRRIARFQSTNGTILESWRQSWIEKYKNDFVPLLPDSNAAAANVEDRRAAAARKRREAQERRRVATQPSV